jgi:hypothetical protein
MLAITRVIALISGVVLLTGAIRSMKPAGRDMAAGFSAAALASWVAALRVESHHVRPPGGGGRHRGRRDLIGRPYLLIRSVYGESHGTSSLLLSCLFRPPADAVP